MRIFGPLSSSIVQARLRRCSHSRNPDISSSSSTTATCFDLQVTVRQTDSPFWKGLIKVKLSFFQRAKHIVGNGASTRFWEDTWLGGYLQSYGTYPFLVATHSDGGQGAFGYWCYPMGDGSSGYLKPVWMAVM
ncbi:uncharacterized protein [Triticum aestivum]|uniref:uncharacterized protein n=1 Tax=Triticum aestivum TaxID=4565 RepID=UPI001D0059F1|nr:uncharacterized protein LOC123157870 [Triticum aestivum]